MSTDHDLCKMEDRKDARCNQVLDAAAECFVAHGFHGASMSKIAKASGMSVGHIYHYFENKDAIIAAIVRRDAEEMMSRICELSGDAEQDVVNLIAGRIHEALEIKTNPIHSVLDLEILAESRRSDTIRKLVQCSDKPVRKALATIVDQRIEVDDTAARVEAVSTIFAGLLERNTRNPDMDTDRLVHYLRAAIRAIFEVETPQ